MIYPRGSVVSFRDLSFEINVRTFPWSCPTRLVVLSQLSGFMPVGMNAIMGPTGCGKSSLLDALAGRKNPNNLSGYVLLDGQRQTPNIHRHLCGYVVQDNIAVGTLTVRENIAFSASLRLPCGMKSKHRKAKVSQVIDELGLTQVADRLLGTDLIRGVSGGERKRTCIGIELVKDPLVLYLDEPTTGLDAYTAGNVMKTLKRLPSRAVVQDRSHNLHFRTLSLHSLADAGRTIVFSIHQPKYSIYRLFDRLTLLADGKMVYHGPSGQAPIDYFHCLGYHLEGYDNPADFLMDTLHGETSPNVSGLDSVQDNLDQPRSIYEEPSRDEVVRRFVDQWQKSDMFRKCQAAVALLYETYEAFSSPRRGSKRHQTRAYDSRDRYRLQHSRCRRVSASVLPSIHSSPSNLAVPTLSDPSDHEDLRSITRVNITHIPCQSTNPTTFFVQRANSLAREPDANVPLVMPRSMPASIGGDVCSVSSEADLPISIASATLCYPNQLWGLSLRRNRSANQRKREGDRQSFNGSFRYDRQELPSREFDRHGCRSKCMRCFRDSPYAAPYYRQLSRIIYRQCLSMIRDYKTAFSHFAIQLIISLFLGIIYYNLDKTVESGIQNRSGLFFFTCMQLMFINGSMLESFLRDRVLFSHETAAGFYRVSAYFFAKIVSEVLPIKALPAILFLPITYYMAELRRSLRAFLFWELTVTLLTITASSVAFSISTMVSDFRVGTTLLSMFFVLMMITGGFLINIASLGEWVRWLRYLSIVRFAMNTFMINEMVGVQFCTGGYRLNSSYWDGQSLTDLFHSHTYASSLSSSDMDTAHNFTEQGICIYGEQYLDTQSIAHNTGWTVWQNEVGILGIFVLALINAYIYLRLIKNYK